jgi:tryptophan synthase alpha chain
MNRIDRLFQEEEGEILSVYVTAGFPRLDDTLHILKSLQDQGVQMVELGMPFSDPLADGPVIQQSSQIALQNGMSLELLFKQLEGVREDIHIPLVLMGYLNPIMQMGMDKFLRKCHETGIDGLIIPDLPPAEYEESYRTLFTGYGIHHILLITPHTEESRIRWIAELSGGFLYMVADAATTGARKSIGSHQEDYFTRIREMELPLPGLIGFGISNRSTFLTACRYAAGAIIGSAFIRALGQEGDLSLEQRVENFIGEIRGGKKLSS